MRVVFMGFQTWGCRVLEALLASRHTVPLVVTHPRSDHPYSKIWDDSVEELARQHGIPVLVREYANDEEAILRVRAVEPDILCSSDWRTWAAPRLCTTARYGAINIHDGLLPKYGGFAPLNWALVNGETEVGVTVHFMSEEFDLGDIVVQRRVPAGQDDTVTDLFQRTLALFPVLALEALDMIESGRHDWVQQDRTQATFFHKRSEEDSRIDWTLSARDIANLVRAQVDPYPNAFTFHHGKRLRILAASVARKRYGGTPGRIFCPEGDGIVIVCGPKARTGLEPGLVVKMVRTCDGLLQPAREYFKVMGGYLTTYS
jgi:methionyl-tRNA formyltransferase